jgi:flagellar biosynthetic protein FlhB
MADSSKTEQATPRRKQKAREKGQVARSRELVTALATMCAGLLLAHEAASFPAVWRSLLARSLTIPEQGANEWFVHPAQTASALLLRVAILIGCTWAIAVASAIAQGGFVFAPSALAPNPSRLSPVARIEQLLSIQSFARLLKSLLPVALILYLATDILLRSRASMLWFAGRNGNALTRAILAPVFEMLWKGALVLLVWSGIDYLVERRKLEGDLRMTRQELRDEYKETEGNPAVKARIRRLQRQVRRRRMLRAVEKATVVITNPTQFAIALEYRPSMAAPVVLAKGRNLLAAQIKQIARWHGIPLVENPPLAHALYRAVEIGQAIPPKLYRVVAEILAAIYRIQAGSGRR